MNFIFYAVAEFSKNKPHPSRKSTLLWNAAEDFSKTTLKELIFSLVDFWLLKISFRRMFCFCDISLYLSASFKEKHSEKKVSEDIQFFSHNIFSLIFLKFTRTFTTQANKKQLITKKKLSIHALEWQKEYSRFIRNLSQHREILEQNFPHRKKRQQAHINCW